MAATSPRDRLLRALLLAAGPAVAVTTYACDDGPSASEGAGNQLATAGAAGTTVAGAAGSAAIGGAGGSSGVGGASGSSSGVGGASGSSSAVGGGSGTAGAAGGVASEFPPAPAGTGEGPNGYPQCGPDQSSPSGFGLHGSCCVDLYCIPLVAGSCPAAENVYRGQGTGTCNCGTSTGPYDPGDATPAADSKGTACCYLAGIIGCDGRPLLIAGEARVAALAELSGGWS